ncbi:VOC family protein [Hymenobacter jeollabukensis]|uniref:Glyoxalase/bleomycin resistance/extradiol dioxygenase family protein n=1 Tax=Hymenobacter jeollabukensis TaxID=2025313 RepID=A0A5R8WSD6_9BACT|nr:VOC family protein [Hymenobacter jeollabukensis]TLM94095.1 glyoxalase/bleomycin resistance/extradiol dioxygenase family protein [Hymenobacter jeollabukensis]
MATKIFVNLPVRDLNASVAFFTRLGFQFNPQFTDEKATCMVISDDIYVMLLVEAFFQTFTPKAVTDARQANEAIICLSVDSRAEVDRLVDAALGGGGQSLPDDEHGAEFMYARNFEDLDGHLWNILYMDPSFAQQPATAAPAETQA